MADKNITHSSHVANHVLFQTILILTNFQRKLCLHKITPKRVMSGGAHPLAD